MLDKLNASFLFLPELNVTVNAASYYELSLGDRNVGDCVPVHKALLISVLNMSKYKY